MKIDIQFKFTKLFSFFLSLRYFILIYYYLIINITSNENIKKSKI